MTEPDAIHCDQFLPHPPATVWKALTDPRLHARWWAAGDVRAEVGHHFTLDMGKWGEQPCEVITVEPERLLSYRFARTTIDTTITWRLEPEGNGTRLFLEHAGFDLDTPMGRTAIEGMGRGWPSLLRRLATVLGEGEGEGDGNGNSNGEGEAAG
ncbi:SRPBCC family protein [Streptomyces melanosporofaciens]